MTTDEIMALARKATGGIHTPEVLEAWGELRAAVEQMVRSLSAWEQVWEGIRDNHEPNLNPTNKPLAVAATFQLAISRAERAEAELANIREMDNRAFGAWQKQRAKLEAERDALRALLARIRDATHTNAVTLRGMADEGLARIDAALKERE